MLEDQNDADDVHVRLEHGGVSYDIFLPNSDKDYIQHGILESRTPYELAMLKDMATRLRPQDLVLDVGANIGNHALFLAAVAQARVVAFEPNRELCAALGRSVARNGLGDAVSIRPCGLGAGAAQASFAESIPTNLGQQTLRLGEGEIEVVALDSLVFDAPIRMIKIDVEGMEIDVLRGGRATIARDRPTLYVECHDEATFLEIAAWAEAEGYGYWDTFNATPTHAFVPKESLSLEARLDKQSARDVVQNYRLASKLRRTERAEARALTRIAELEAAAAARAEKARVQREEAARRIATLEAELRRMTGLLDKERASLRASLRAREETLGGLERRLAETHAEIGRLHKYGLDVETKYAEILASEAWRATEPVRWVLQRVRKRPNRKPFKPQLRDYVPPPLPTLETLHRRAAGATPAEHVAFLAPDPRRTRSDRRVVFMTTFPARAANLPAVVEAILPQCDVLNVYLNDYDHVPEILRHDKIRATLGRDAAGDLKDNGKFYNCHEYQDCHHIFIDDDIVYPWNYVDVLVERIKRYGYRAIVGVHGTIYKEPVESYLANRIVLPFYAGSRAAVVDQLGTGTVAYHTSTFSVDLPAFETTGIADLWFAKRAAERGVPLVAIDRADHWMRRMDEVGDTLFRQLQKDDGKESGLLRDRLVPALRDGARARFVRFVQDLYVPDHVARNKLNMDVSLSGAFAPAPDRRSDVHFALIVAGWNCDTHVRACLASIERQVMGDYSLEIHAYDDASDDGTWDALQACAGKLRIDRVRGETNMGPAFARDVLLRRVENPDAICVLLDMDDELLPDALVELERIYRADPECWMTYGNWVNQKGEINVEGVYSAQEIDERAYRSLDVFKFTHLRTFRRFLYDKVDPSHLKDENGEWLRFCSDVGLMLPIADQCASKNVVAVDRPLYLYNRYRPTGTQKRFGARKKEVFKYLQNKTRALAET